MTGNMILDALPDDRREALLSDAREVDLDRSRVLFESGRAIDSVAFPTTAVMSLVIGSKSGATVEAAMVGREGMAGTGVVLGHRRGATWTAVTQIPGRAITMSADALEAHLADDGKFSDLLRTATFALMSQMAQTVACNRLHEAEDRLARWLSQARDTAGDDLPLTQEFIAEMLGVRRATVTVAARTLQDDGVIEYRRGHVRVVDPERLEERACECLAVIRSEHARISEGVGV